MYSSNAKAVWSVGTAACRACLQALLRMCHWKCGTGVASQERHQKRTSSAQCWTGLCWKAQRNSGWLEQAPTGETEYSWRHHVVVI